MTQNKPVSESEAVEIMWRAVYGDAAPIGDYRFQRIQYRALVAAGVIPQWRGIESAPKDGFHLMLYRPHICFVGYYAAGGGLDYQRAGAANNEPATNPLDAPPTITNPRRASMTTDTQALAARLARYAELDIDGKREAIGFRDLYEYEYEKYGEHVVAIKCGGGGLRLFDSVNLFSENNSRKEYERVKGEAADFAKAMVAQFNAAPAMASDIALLQGVIAELADFVSKTQGHMLPSADARVREQVLALASPLVAKGGE